MHFRYMNEQHNHYSSEVHMDEQFNRYLSAVYMYVNVKKYRALST